MYERRTSFQSLSRSSAMIQRLCLFAATLACVKPSRRTIGKWLADAGYYTAFHGKYVKSASMIFRKSPANGWRLLRAYNFYNASAWAVEARSARRPARDGAGDDGRAPGRLPWQLHARVGAEGDGGGETISEPKQDRHVRMYY